MHAIMADAAGRFWINSNQGVYTLERAELAELVVDRRDVALAGRGGERARRERRPAAQ